ncbi:endoplasmic reticulum export factor CTAGE5-like [Octodon degus]|uniref:Endoplasmic reticulum export factor CTAGE5-like n=1 Tax=Octodon degus TaxID=10160 RepID=A0A6P3V9L2_OCTDE|nr:endoplasmic reticulum export factor CTAGE5-like [Octodon degus]
MGFLTLLFVSWKTFHSIRSLFTVQRTKHLAPHLAGYIKEKHQLLEKVGQIQKENEGLEAALKEARVLEKEGARQAQGWEAAYKDMARFRGRITSILTELKEEQSQHCKKQQLRMKVMSGRIRSLIQESKLLTAEIAEVKVALLNFSKEQLQREVKDTVRQKAQLQESQGQLLQEARRWKEQVGTLTSQKTALHDAWVGAGQLLQGKGQHREALSGHLLLPTKGGASGPPGDRTPPEDYQQEVRRQPQSCPGFADGPEGPSERLVFSTQVNASFQTLEEQRGRLHAQLLGAQQTNEELAESVRHLQTQRASLQSDNTELRRERQKLQLKFTVKTEVHQQTILSCYRKLSLAAKTRAQQEPKLEEVGRVAEELETYRKRVQDMEEEWERTLRFYQRQVTSMQREACENWDKAVIAERRLQDLRRENARTRQILCAAELKDSLVGKHPATLSVTKSTSGPERSPRGPSPRRRPRPTSKRSVCPLPTLWEEPLGGQVSSPTGPGNSQLDLTQLSLLQAHPSARA